MNNLSLESKTWASIRYQVFINSKIEVIEVNLFKLRVRLLNSKKKNARPKLSLGLFDPPNKNPDSLMPRI